MFLKKQLVRRGSDTYTYYRLVESYRNADGKVRHRTVRYVGKLDDAQAAALRQMLQHCTTKMQVFDWIDALKQPDVLEQASVSVHVDQAELSDMERNGDKAGLHNTIAIHQQSAISTLSMLPTTWIPLSFTKMYFHSTDAQEWMVADEHTLLLIGKGQAQVTIRGRMTTMGASQLLFCPAGAGVHIGGTGQQPLELYRLALREISGEQGKDASMANDTLPSFLPDELRNGDTAGIAIVLSIHSPAEMRRLCEEMEQAITHAVPTWRTLNMLACYRSFYELLHLLSLETSSDRYEEQLSFQQMIRYVQQHYREDLRRDELARKTGMTPEHFSRTFRSHKGCSFSQYLSGLRLHQARLELQLSHASLDEIARRCGYGDTHYFSRKFKQQLGMPPRQYRTAPKSYVTWNAPLTAMLLYLGIVPAAGHVDMQILRRWQEQRHAMESELLLDNGSLAAHQLELIANMPSPSLPLLDTLQPDLVFTYDNDPYADLLSEYAPVQHLPVEQYSWRQQWLWLAERVQRSEQAQVWLDRWDVMLTQVKQKLRHWLDTGETVGIYKIVSEKVYVYGNLRSMGGPLIYDGLGCHPPEKVRQQLIHTGLLNIEVPLHRLDEYAADHMIVIHYPLEHQDGQPRQGATSVMESSAWKQLPAVQAGKVHLMDRHVFYGFDPFSQQLQLQDWLDRLASYL
ncbi:AraC family transcriptional regulator [Paenibacillus kandeliae]|uniref:AraC family transcriptional regulator n=1 Tax=Paenibacillus kandeliae TaxID=3231269 RepID=UPI0034585AE8